MAIEWEVSEDKPLSFDTAGFPSLEWGATEYIPAVSGKVPQYDGAYEITPTSETQTLSTADMMMLADVTINPIPSNYGLITWDGSTLLVS